MQERGYKVDRIPEDTKEFIAELTANATNDKNLLTEKQIAEANKVTSAEYKKFYDTFEPKVQAQLVKDWGEAPGTVMEYDGNLLVPGTMYGNVFVTVQPPRGFGDDPSKIYHSPYCAPTHHYLAFYHWVRDIWEANAVAHIGTHGSLEWLPGKNAGLDCTCYPDLALGDLVNIYPYNICITGEGIQAKRRGAACLIEHLPAPQSKAGVYDELEELEKIMDEYVHFETTQPENLSHLEELVKEKVTAANLQDEVEYDESKPFGEYVMALHNYITDLKNLEVHVGLHILGQPPVEEGLTVTCPTNTTIVVEGIDKQRVGELSANIRATRKPEPYKGKGVRYKGEIIRRKEGKTAGKK
jgi:cobaltochelatase CobN